MKIFFLLFVLPAVIFAKSYILSDVPLPKTYIQNLDPYPCDEKCMKEYLDNGMVFSFLSYAKTPLKTPELDEFRIAGMNLFNIGSNIVTSKFKIALLLPYKIIGRYASSTTNASFAYLIAKNHPFELKSYQIENQSVEAISQKLSEIKNDGFEYVIAPLTQQGVKSVLEVNPTVNIYFPTVNIKDVESSTENLYYGGIDYRAQSDVLLQQATSPLVIISDKSSIGKKLGLYEEESFLSNSQQKHKRVLKFFIPRKRTNLEREFKKNKYIEYGSFFINTPIVKTGMIMSQLTLYDTKASNVLSTQINYNPLILSITQYDDRKNMLIANSITVDNDMLVELNDLLGNDIVYDWINYTTTVGVDFFYSSFTHENREYNINIDNNQMHYPIEIVRPTRYRFVKVSE